jgi:hypothetical protein
MSSSVNETCALLCDTDKDEGVVKDGWRHHCGHVVDPSNAPLDHVKVSIHNEETGTERDLITHDDGKFSAPSIPVGVYLVSVEKDGSAPLKRSGVALSVGESVQLHLMLTLGKVEEVLTEFTHFNGSHEL